MGTTASILIVDDDRSLRELLAQVLTDAGYAVETASDGASALALIAANPPHLVVLDYAMPRMSGREVIAQLRTSGVRNLPILVLSASIYAESSLADGATRYIAKPFLLVPFLDAVAACLHGEANPPAEPVRSAAPDLP